MMGALALAALAALADHELRADGEGALAALNSGYHAAFLVGALLVAAAGVIGAVLLRAGAPAPGHGAEQAVGSPAVAEAD